MEKTFLMIKPDGVQRNLIGDIVNRFEEKGYKLVGAKLMQIDRSLAEQHYGEHRERPFFGELVDFITSGPVFAMVWEGNNVVAASRSLMGATNPQDAAPGTIRGDYAVSLGMNIIHRRALNVKSAFSLSRKKLLTTIERLTVGSKEISCC
jgi:nucleoside-diphosphate kinase